jgi:ABC-type bacteriocin/lantibiotic exporter with double-glycine peptidase domain
MVSGGDGDRDRETVTDHAKAKAQAEPLAATGARQQALQAPLATLYGYIWRISGRRQIWLTLLSSVVFPLQAVPLELQRRIVNHAIGALDLRLLWLYCSMYAGVVLIQGGLKYLLNVYREVVSERAIRSMRQQIYDAIRSAKRPPPTETPGATATGSRLAMVVAEVEPLGAFVGESISLPLVQLGGLLSVLGYMLWIEPRIAVATLILYSPQLFLVPRIQAAINRRVQRRIVLVREMGEHVVQEAARAATPAMRARQYEERIHKIYRQQVRIAYLSYSLTLLNNLLEHSGTISVLMIGGWLVIHGQTDVGTIVAFVSGFERISDPWRELVSFYRRASAARVKYQLVRDVVDWPQTGRAEAKGAASGS